MCLLLGATNLVAEEEDLELLDAIDDVVNEDVASVVAEPGEVVEPGEVIEPVVFDNSAAIAERVENIAKARTRAATGLNKQADTMLTKNKKMINSFKVNNMVLLATDGVDRGASDAPNLLCMIMEKKDISFRLGCTAGILDRWFAFNQLQSTNFVGFQKESIPDTTVSVREAIRLISVGTEQGVLKCSCKAGKCTNCSCTKAVPPQKCNSRCHGGNVNTKCCNKLLQ